MKPLAEPSQFFVEQTSALRDAARLGPIADLASGRGRHALASAELGARVLAIDRNPAFLSELRRRARSRDLALECIRADLESPPELPLKPGSCGAILVFRFLYRPLASAIEQALCPGGLLLYETFRNAQLELSGGPRNPAFLLADGELPSLFPALETVAYVERIEDRAGASALACLAARRPERH